MHLIRECFYGFYQLILMRDADRGFNEGDIRLDVLHADAQSPSGGLLGGIEVVRHSWVNRAKLREGVHHNFVRTERHQGCRAICRVWDQNVEILGKFPEQRDKPPRYSSASAIAAKK